MLSWGGVSINFRTWGGCHSQLLCRSMQDPHGRSVLMGRTGRGRGWQVRGPSKQTSPYKLDLPFDPNPGARGWQVMGPSEQTSPYRSCGYSFPLPMQSGVARRWAEKPPLQIHILLGIRIGASAGTDPGRLNWSRDDSGSDGRLLLQRCDDWVA